VLRPSGFLSITAHTANDPEPAFAGDGSGNQKSETGTICGNIGAQLNSAVQLELQQHVPQPLTGFVERGPIG
jgi:hypothetical protein